MNNQEELYETKVMPDLKTALVKVFFHLISF